jgi:hypothetical protein
MVVPAVRGGQDRGGSLGVTATAQQGAHAQAIARASCERHATHRKEESTNSEVVGAPLRAALPLRLCGARGGDSDARAHSPPPLAVSVPAPSAVCCCCCGLDGMPAADTAGVLPPVCGTTVLASLDNNPARVTLPAMAAACGLAPAASALAL